jgi:hypothetical protein
LHICRPYDDGGWSDCRLASPRPDLLPRPQVSCVRCSVCGVRGGAAPAHQVREIPAERLSLGGWNKHAGCGTAHWANEQQQ